MAEVSGIISFEAGERIYASQHNTNWTTMSSFVNGLAAGDNFNSAAIGSSLLASAAVTGEKLAANAVTKDKLATAVSNALAPAGAIMQYAGATVPSGWLFCDGSTINRTTYADLFAAIGTTYGSGDGSTTFGIPNLKGRVPVGLDAAQTEFDALGETGGAKTVTLTTGQMPSHSHTGPSHQHTMGSHTHTINHDHSDTTTGSDSHSHTLDIEGTPSLSHMHFSSSANSASGEPSGGTAAVISGAVNSDTHSHTVNTPAYSGSSGVPSNNLTDASGTTATSTTGSSEAHNNLQPYIVVNYIIKV